MLQLTTQRSLTLWTLAAAVWFLADSEVLAQRIFVPNAPASPTAPLAPRVRQAAQPRALAPITRRPVSKPFSDIQRRPTVSPYLNLGRDDSAAPDYQTLVRPQLEQLEFNRRQSLEVDRLNRQVQDFRTQAAFPAGGSPDLRATGHSTRFMNTSHFFPR